MDFFHGISGDYAFVCTAFFLGLCPLMLGFIIKYLWKPWIIHKQLQKHGFKGRWPRLMIGDLLDIANMVQKEMLQDMPCIDHDFRGRVFPYFTEWSKIYGERFVIWFGYEPRIVLTDPELIKQLLSSKHLHLSGRSPLVQKMLSVAFGEGLITVNGGKWTRQRRIVAPAFHSEKLKTLVDIMVMCTTEMLDGWEKIAYASDKPCEIELTSHMDSLTADVFIRAEFGMDYNAGKELFEDIRSLETLMLRACRYLWLPGSRFLPTPTNLEIWKRTRRLERNLKRMLDARRDSQSYGADLLGLMLSEIDRASTNEINFIYTSQQVMDECKTFFLGGRETTSLLLSWGVMLLALNPDWQHKAREEAWSVCGINNPTSDSVGKFKIIGMILNETLRLYPPASGIIRYAFEDLQLGEDLVIPKGVNVIVDILAVHRDPKLWGSDANEFKPQRFADGIAKAATHSSAFVPFSSGPRVCIGQNFAMLEAKVAMAMILKRFRFGISSSYRHAPVSFITLNPQHGMPIRMERIHR